MRGQSRRVVSYDIEDLTHEELEIILEWARIAKLAQQDQVGRGWSKGEAELAESLKRLYVSEDENEEIVAYGVQAEKERETGAEVETRAKPRLSREWDRRIEVGGDESKNMEVGGGIVDTGEGMIWRER